MAVNQGFQIPAALRIGLLRQALAKDPKSTRALFELSEALAEVGEHEESVELFRRVRALDSSAGGPLADPGRNAGPEKGAKMRERALALIAGGAICSPVIAALAVGEALCGNEAAVRYLVDYTRFFRCYPMKAPEGFPDFNAALADEIRSGLRFYDEPAHRAIRKGWRNDGTTRSALPASAALTQSLRREVASYIAALPNSPEHPFIRSAPAEFTVGGWAVVSDGSTYHKPHIHPEAWMSCVYYVVRPPVSREPGAGRGWMTVGPPEWDECPGLQLPGWDSTMVAPEPGNLVLMPGYFYHRTSPMGVDQERICVAADIIPVA